MILKGVNQIEMLFTPVTFKKSLLAQKDEFVKKTDVRKSEVIKISDKQLIE